MKWCLRSRLSPKYLKQADEIRVDFRDMESIPDVYHDYKKTIILFPALNGEEYDWQKIVKFSQLCEGKLIISCPSIQELNMAKNHDLRYFLAKEANSGWDLQAMEELGCEYAYIGIPVFFDLPRIKQKHDIKLRAIPTVSYNHHLPHKWGIRGQWIRPEDVEAYEDYIEVMEFEFCEIRREETLYKVYAIEKEWSTRLDILVDDLGSSAINRYIPDTLVQTRLSCGQRCMSGDNYCHLCQTTLHIAESDMAEKIHKVLKKNPSVDNK